MSGSDLSVNKSADNNVVLRLCWHNSDLDEEMPTCSDKTQAAHGIAIQEVASPDTSAGVAILRIESHVTVSTKPRTIKHQKIVIKPCNAKANVESKLAVTYIKL